MYQCVQCPKEQELFSWRPLRYSPAVGSKNCAFYDKRMKLGTLAAHIFLKKIRYRAIAD